MKQVIHIYGASGSGTSTLGKYISEKAGCFFMDTDDYFWEATDPPYTVKRKLSERLELMKNDLAEYDNAVISGSLVGWGDELIPLFTLAIRVETATQIRIERLKKRELEHFGDRIRFGGDMYQNHLDFMEWAAAYDDGGLDMRSKQEHDEWEKLLRCQIIKVDGSRSVDSNFKIIYESMKHNGNNKFQVAD